MVTIKTHQGLLLLNPDEANGELSNFVGYCLARALEASGAEFHGGVVMGNHLHMLVTDPLAELPRFKHVLHMLLARGFNARRGRFDKFWSARGSCDTSRSDADDTLADLVYILVNPVKAELVKRGGLWPGFTSYAWKFGEARTFKRPRWFFDAANEELPDEVVVRLKRPPVFEKELTDDGLFDRLTTEVRAREKQIQDRVRREHRRFMGVRKLLRQRPDRAPRKSPERFGQAPRVAGSSRWEILAGLTRDREWAREYARAMDAYDAGDREVVFPYGTYLMERRMHVNVATGPP